MVDLNRTFNAITIAIFVGLAFSFIVFEDTVEDIVAVVIIVASVSGLALNWFSRQHGMQEGGWKEERERWEEADRWW
jgi:hypothetical protein